MHDVFEPARLGPVTLRNRTIKSSTYEGRSRKGLVTDQLIDFHVAMAQGGVGMTTVAYCAVAPEGRTDANQIHWRPEAVGGLRKLTDAVHAEGAAVSAQIGHAGLVAGLDAARGFPLGPGWGGMGQGIARRASASRLKEVAAAHGRAAAMAIEAGFDAVEIHFGHNYLVSSFLSPKLNHRKDSYGGPLENRARLAREVARAVRDNAGGKLAVTAKLNMDDGVRGGFGLDEAVTVAQWLERDGTVDALELTAGSSLLNPMYLFKGDAPVKEFAEAFPGPFGPALKRFGHKLIREYPYTDGYLLEDSKRVREAVNLPLILLGGITGKPMMDRAMAEGFDFVAMGRALLMEPDLINRIQADASVTSNCVHCNKCMPTIYSRARCVLVDPVP
ncbi:MAG: NADH:flavin oxidoreductase [Streptosporangiales bacterium]|nr:NADH:flavin oxidoreductase [Streptosporangiales bacterium]